MGYRIETTTNDDGRVLAETYIEGDGRDTISALATAQTPPDSFEQNMVRVRIGFGVSAGMSGVLYVDRDADGHVTGVGLRDDLGRAVLAALAAHYERKDQEAERRAEAQA